MPRSTILLDALSAKARGRTAIERSRRRRFAALVAFARANSPYYRHLYRRLPEQVSDPDRLPLTTKPDLLDHYDEWATDRAVTLSRARSFADDARRVGEPFMGSYLLACSSGTTGIRGIFVADERALAVSDALRVRALASWLSFRDAARIVGAGGRTVTLSATHGHFMAVGLARRSGLRRRAVSALSVTAPVPKLVERINRLQPAILAGYASMIVLLASEQQAGRLSIDPVLVATSAEGLTPSRSQWLTRAFGARYGDTHAAVECPFIGHSCESGWLHLNSDWVVLEPVDAGLGPVPDGELSSGVLLTNLANRSQPLIRYVMDDRILLSPDPCSCGSPLPAYRLQGRGSDTLTLRGDHGSVAVPELPMAILLEGVDGIEGFQIVQTTASTLRVRLRFSPDSDSAVLWRTVHDSLTRFLRERRLSAVTVEPGSEPPQQTHGGKYLKVIPLEQRGPLAGRVTAAR